MNPPPALVALFTARIDRVLEHLRDANGAGVLPSHREEWPDTLPRPLTVADARAAVTGDRGRMAAELAAEVAHLVAERVPAEWQAGALADPDVVNAWCWLRGGAERHAPGGPLALGVLLRVLPVPFEPVPYLFDRSWRPEPGETGAPRRRRPHGYPWQGVSLQWAPDVLHTDELSGTLGNYIDTPPAPWGPPPRVRMGLDALFRHLVARSPLFAAVEAGRLVRELTAAGDPGPAYLAAVRDALGSYARSVEDPDALAAAALEDTPTARRRLSGYAVDLLDAARKVAALFAVDPVDDDAARETAETSNGPALRWDVAFAALLTARGDLVRSLAAGRWAAVYGPQVPIPDTPRPPPGSLWALWAARDDGPRWLLWLAADLWVSVWRPAALFEQAKRAPAMPLLLRRELRGIRAGVNDRKDGETAARLKAPERGGFEYLALDGTTVARFSGPSLNRTQLAAMKQGIKHLRGMLFERVTRGLVRDCFEQAARGVNPFTRLVWAHGYEGVAAAYGINSKDRARLPELFEAMHAYRGSDRNIPPLISGFWLTGAAGRAGRAAELRCDVGEALAPGYASVVAGMSNTARGDEWLLPVLPVPFLALEGAAPADYGAVCDLQWELLALFRERAEEGRDRGGWLLSEKDRAAVADHAELRPKLARAWWTPWTTGPGAWLRELPGGRLALVDEDAAELLRDAANYTTTARKRGQQTKAKKTKQR